MIGFSKLGQRKMKMRIKISRNSTVAVLLAGLGQLGGVTPIGLHVRGNHRAEANAVLNIGCYIPAGLMPVATGIIIDQAGFSLGATLLAAMAVIGGATVFRKLAKD